MWGLKAKNAQVEENMDVSDCTGDGIVQPINITEACGLCQAELVCNFCYISRSPSTVRDRTAPAGWRQRGQFRFQQGRSHGEIQNVWIEQLRPPDQMLVGLRECGRRDQSFKVAIFQTCGPSWRWWETSSSCVPLYHSFSIKKVWSLREFCRSSQSIRGRMCTEWQGNKLITGTITLSFLILPHTYSVNVVGTNCPL